MWRSEQGSRDSVAAVFAGPWTSPPGPPLGARGLTVRPVLGGSPQARHAIGVEGALNRHDVEVLEHRLGDQHAVEWIAQRPG
jgi:hypothetical protein